MPRQFLSCLFLLPVWVLVASVPCVGTPLTNAPVWFAEGLDFGGQFGTSVAAAGDVNGDGFSDLIVGAPLAGLAEEGWVFLYLGSEDGVASSPTWSVGGEIAGAHLGASVAPAGDTNGDGYGDVIVGAPGYQEGLPSEGRAVLFLGCSSGLSASPTWSARGRQARARFGASVAGAGDLDGDGFDDVVVGAPGAYTCEVEEGRAFVFLGGVAGLSEPAVWTTGGGELGAAHGASVASAGDVNADGYGDLLIGAPGTGLGGMSAGRVCLYLGGPSGPAMIPSWSKIGEQPGSLFGASVAGAGDLDGDGYADIAVGAPGQDTSLKDVGAGFVFSGSTSGPSDGPDWTMLGDTPGSRLGTSIATAGDVDGDGLADLIVGAPGELNDGSATGEVYLFLGAASGLGSSIAWSAMGEVDPSQFGSCVCSAGDLDGDGFGDIVVGAWRRSGGRGEEGAAYAFGGSARPPISIPSWSLSTDVPGGFLGFTMASAGDVNGDGYDDLLVSTPFYSSAQPLVGKVDLYLGSSSGIHGEPVWSQTGNAGYSYYGYSLGRAGDVNGDGFPDVIISAYYGGTNGHGRAYLYAGSPMGLSILPVWTGASRGQNDSYGYSVAGAGDVNGDGYADLIVGAIGCDAPDTDEGKAFLYLGSPGWPSTQAAWVAEGGQELAEFGWSVSSAGDVNGDGFDDVVVGAHRYDCEPGADAGRACVYLGSEGGLSVSPSWVVCGETPGSLFGNTVASAGDTNGDGYSDVIVTAPNLGYVYLFEGSPTGLSSEASWATDIRASQMGWVFDTNVASAGDINADGFGDVLVGDPWRTGGGGRGRAYLFPGSPEGLAEEPVWSAQSSVLGLFGHLVASAGDVNGDGFGDIAVGDPWADQYPPGYGRAYLYLGNGGGGLPRTPGAWTVGGAAPIALRGLSDNPYAFRLRAIGRTPAGRGEVWLDTEVKPLGVPFDGIGIRSGTHRQTESPQAPLGSVASLDELLPPDLQPDTAHHWRERLASSHPFFPRSPWFSPQGNSPSEVDLRTRPAQAADAGTAGDATGPRNLLELDRVSPNPFTDRLHIDFVLHETGDVRVTLIDPSGRRVATLAEGLRVPGRHRVEWDGLDRWGLTSSGIYLLRIEALGETRTLKVARRR